MKYIKQYKMFESSTDRVSYNLWDKITKMNYQYEEVCDYLKDELIGKVVKFKCFGGNGEWRKETVDDVLLDSKVNIHFVCNGIRYRPNMVYPIEYEIVTEKENTCSFSLWDKFRSFDRNFEELLDYLKRELLGKSVKFKLMSGGGKDPYMTEIIDDIEYKSDYVFICGDKRYYPSVICEIEYKKIENIDKIWIVGVPSGLALEIDRKKTFLKLYDSGLLFFADNYKPTFYAFKDGNIDKVRGIINKVMLNDILDKN